MKSFGIVGAAIAALLVAGCRGSKPESDGMMSGKSGKEGSSCSTSKEAGCPFQAAAKKDGCCAEGTNATVKEGCCKGKAVSVACDECKKACEAAGGCETGKKCDEKACDEKKP